jgi:hypothetical protein
MFTDLTFSADVLDGKLTLADERSYRQQLRHFKNGKVIVRIELDREKRSGQANRYYRLVLGLISDDTGDDPDSLHEFFKRKFQESKIVHTSWNTDIEVWTTADNDPEKFHAYVENVRRFALMERGIVTPDPDPRLRGKSRHASREKGQAA